MIIRCERLLGPLTGAMLLAACGHSTSTGDAGDPGADGGAEVTPDSGPQDAGLMSPLVNEVTGSVQGLTFTAMAGAAEGASQLDFPGSAGVFVSDDSALCRGLTGGYFPQGSSILAMFLAQTDANGNDTAVATGELEVTATRWTMLPPSSSAAYVVLRHFDGMCSTDDLVATGGSVTVTAAGDLARGGALQGTFQLQFGTDQLSGSFGTPPCNGMLPFGSLMCEGADGGP